MIPLIWLVRQCPLPLHHGSPPRSCALGKPGAFKPNCPSILRVPSPPGIGSCGGLWGCPRPPAPPGGSFCCKVREPPGLDGVLECAQSRLAFPDLIPSKWPIWDGCRAGQRPEPVVSSADLSVVCPLADQSSSPQPWFQAELPRVLSGSGKTNKQSHRGSISRSLSLDRLCPDRGTPDGATSTGTSCGQCEGASQTPLATEELQRQMVSVLGGTEQGGYLPSSQHRPLGPSLAVRESQEQRPEASVFMVWLSHPCPLSAGSSQCRQ